MSGKKRSPASAGKPPTGSKRGRHVRPAHGEHAAVRLALNLSGGPKPPVEEPEQLDIEDLLGLPRTQAVKDLEATEEPERKAGRPKGSLNRRTVEWAEFLLARYASPLEVLAQIANASVKALVASLGCTRLEALQEKRFAALALAPFIHSKQPVSVDVTNRSLVFLTINNGNRFEVGKGVGLTATVIDGKANGATAQS